MARPKRIIKRAARKTAKAIGYTAPQAKAYAKGAVQAIRPSGVSSESKTYRKQIAGQMTASQRLRVRKYDRKG